MPVTVGLVVNVFNEINALPGWLEEHLPIFDAVHVLHAGPGGEYSNDGTIELLEKWSIPVQFCAIDEGFGAVRTQALRMSPCDYVMLLDADERFFHYVTRGLVCSGPSTPQAEVDAILRSYDNRETASGCGPDWQLIGRLGRELQVSNWNVMSGGPIDQMQNLRVLLESDRPDAVVAIRRHWHDLSLTRPTQNWLLEPDWQMRILRNNPDIYFDPSTRMHERLVGASRVSRASFECGPFYDHFHLWFKRMEYSQRRHDVATYDAIHEGRKPLTSEEFNSK